MDVALGAVGSSPPTPAGKAQYRRARVRQPGKVQLTVNGLDVLHRSAGQFPDAIRAERVVRQDGKSPSSEAQDRRSRQSTHSAQPHGAVEQHILAVLERQGPIEFGASASKGVFRPQLTANLPGLCHAGDRTASSR